MNAIKTVQLKDCPFCGQAPELKVRKNITSIGRVYKTFAVSCPECKATIGDDTAEEAVNKWNRREGASTNGK